MISAAPLFSSSSPTARPMFARAIGWSGARGLDEQVARFIQHRGGQRSSSAPSMVENPAIGELQWPLRTHSTSRYGIGASVARPESSMADKICRVCQSLIAHFHRDNPLPLPPGRYLLN